MILDFPLSYPTLYVEAGIGDSLLSMVGGLIWPQDQGPFQNLFRLVEFGSMFVLPGVAQVIMMIAGVLGFSLEGLGAWIDKLLGVKSFNDLATINLSDAVQSIMKGFSPEQLTEFMKASVNSGVIGMFNGSDESPATPGIAQSSSDFPLAKYAERTEADEVAGEMRRRRAEYEKEMNSVDFDNLPPDELANPRVKKQVEKYELERKEYEKTLDSKIQSTLNSHNSALPLNGEEHNETMAREAHERYKQQLSKAAPGSNQARALAEKVQETEENWKNRAASRMRKAEKFVPTRTALKAKDAAKKAIVDLRVGTKLWSPKGDRIPNLLRTFRTKGAAGSIVTGLTVALQFALQAAGKIVSLGGSFALKHPLMALAGAAATGITVFGLASSSGKKEEIAKVGEQQAVAGSVAKEVDTDAQRLQDKAPQNFGEKLAFYVEATISSSQ